MHNATFACSELVGYRTKTLELDRVFEKTSEACNQEHL